MSNASYTPCTGSYNGQHSNTVYMSAQLAHMNAFTATPNSMVDPNWYPDSGATDYCTPAVHNLIHKDSYQDSEMLHMGDGTGLQINILVTKAILMVGKLSNVLYLFDSTTLPFTATSPSFKSCSNVQSFSPLCSTHYNHFFVTSIPDQCNNSLNTFSPTT
ncbi:hypothetical protein PanWU01x14_243650 [Parasponia andersonii]|uniref:Uncharacterized protein n=1 Tax=Parasponia andersonii TaxID=3476 RepID=A0A2P5BFF4_PARAD|nr:hypothetical protein PanWU01x14_243650 [Parasponia andersonii]